MTEIDRLLEQLRCAFGGEAWHGPSLMEALEGVTARQAAARLPGGAHSIGEIARHLLSTSRVVCRRLAGERAEASSAEDWPVVADLSEAAWAEVLESLRASQAELLDRVAGFDPAALDAPIVAGFSSVCRTLHGHAQHMVYHAGQVMLLRRMLDPLGGGWRDET